MNDFLVNDIGPQKSVPDSEDTRDPDDCAPYCRCGTYEKEHHYLWCIWKDKHEYLITSKTFIENGSGCFVDLIAGGLDLLDLNPRDLSQQLEVVPASVSSWLQGSSVPLLGMQRVAIARLRKRNEPECSECGVYAPDHAITCEISETPPLRDEKLAELAKKAGLL